MGWPTNFDSFAPKLTASNPRTRRAIPAHLAKATRRTQPAFPLRRLVRLPRPIRVDSSPGVASAARPITLLPDLCVTFSLSAGEVRYFRLFVHSPTPALHIASDTPYYVRHGGLPSDLVHDLQSTEHPGAGYGVEILEPALGFWSIAAVPWFSGGSRDCWIVGAYDLYGGGYQHRTPNRAIHRGTASAHSARFV